MAKKRTHEDFVNKVRDLTENSYLVIGKYVKSSVKVELKHISCGNSYFVTPNQFINRGNRCPYCSGNKRRTQKEFESEIYKLVGEEYTVIGKYIRSTTKVKMRHNLCGTDYEVRPSNFIFANNRCPTCEGNIKKTHEEFIKEVDALVGEDYVVLGEYKSARTPVKVKHKACGTVYDTKPNNFLSNKRCPTCKSSKGELQIKKVLESLGVKYKTEYTFTGLVGLHGGLLRFDFVILDDNDNVLGLVEYDGEFHFIDFYKNSSFENTKEHDEIKNLYCKASKIPLLRIPYWDFDNIKKNTSWFFK